MQSRDLEQSIAFNSVDSALALLGLSILIQRFPTQRSTSVVAENGAAWQLVVGLQRIPTAIHSDADMQETPFSRSAAEGGRNTLTVRLVTALRPALSVTLS